MMVNIVHALLSSICITIPEFIFMIIITLKLMDRKEMLDFIYNVKENLIYILIIVTPSAIVYDILNYIIKSPIIINRLISFAMLYILLIHICNYVSNKISLDYQKLYKKALKNLFISLLIAMTIESCTYPIILMLVKKTIEEIKSDFNLILLCSLAVRIVDIIILTYLIIKKNNKFQVNIREYILKNDFFSKLLIGIIIGLVIFEGYFMKSLVCNNLLNIYNTLYEQLFVVIGVTFLIPGLIIILVYSCFNYCIMVINNEKQTIQKD